VIFQQSEINIILFLKHIWATDGCIFVRKQNKKGALVSIYYASGSRKLANDISHLLLRVGIISTVRKSSKKSYEDIWNVSIQGKTEQMKFLLEIGSVGKKEKIGKEAVKMLKKVKDNPNNDVIPKEAWKIIEEQRKQQKITSRQFHSLLGWAYSGTQRQKNGLSRERLGKIIMVLKNKNLENLVNSDLYWDEVKEIKKMGVKEVYDATVPKYENFVANDILVHNSIEQDADVVMFIWREDNENTENVTLDISKHRNGPLKTINLFFKGDRIKFYGRETKHSQST
jgi:replicative DNA helicase